MTFIKIEVFRVFLISPNENEALSVGDFPDVACTSFFKGTGQAPLKVNMQFKIQFKDTDSGCLTVMLLVLARLYR